MKKIIKIYREQLGDQGHKINSNVQKDQDQTQNQNSIQQEQIGFYKIVIHLNSSNINKDQVIKMQRVSPNKILEECLKLMNNLKDDRREQQIKKSIKLCQIQEVVDWNMK